MWDSCLQKHVEGQSQKGCCWKQDLETYFWFPVSVWGWACVCVVCLFFLCHWYLPYFDIISTKSGPQLLCVFIGIACTTFCFEVTFALVEILFLVWCFSESCFLGKVWRIVRCLVCGRHLLGVSGIITKMCLSISMYLLSFWEVASTSLLHFTSNM